MLIMCQQNMQGLMELCVMESVKHSYREATVDWHCCIWWQTVACLTMMRKHETDFVRGMHLHLYPPVTGHVVTQIDSNCHIQTLPAVYNIAYVGNWHHCKYHQRQPWEVLHWIGLYESFSKLLPGCYRRCWATHYLGNAIDVAAAKPCQTVVCWWHLQDDMETFCPVSASTCFCEERLRS